MRLITGLLILILLQSSQTFAFPSEKLKELWDFPIGSIKHKTIKKYYKGSINVEEVYYQSREFKGKPAQIFGYYCYPAANNKKLPAILISHGGGGCANLANTIAWAKHGYAVLSIDLPGKGIQRLNSRSTGPDMDVPILLRTRPDPSYNYLIHAVAAARNGITFLSQRKEVDPQRIGMVGLSWGGVITLLTNGQDKRLKTAVNVFGAGYIPEGCTWQTRFNNKSSKELNEWYSFIDPKNFLKTQHAPILFITGTNDHCYYLPTFQKSYEEVTVPKKIVLIPNLRHRFPPYMQSIVLSWLDNKLKRRGSFPRVEILPIFKKGEDKIIVQATAKTCSKLTKMTLYYTQGEPSRWTRRKWQSIDAYHEDGVYYFAIPAALIKPEVMFYVTARDDKGSATSSMIRSILRIKTLNDNETFALSSPIKKINTHGTPYQIIGWKNTAPFRLQFMKKKKIYSMLEMGLN